MRRVMWTIIAALLLATPAVARPLDDRSDELQSPRDRSDELQTPRSADEAPAPR